MWAKSWTLKEGFLVGGGLIIAGLMLELSVGPVRWDAFVWPVGGLAMAFFVVLLVVVHLLRRRVYAIRFLSTYAAAVPALTYAVVLTMVMGLTRQTVNGTWVNNMLTFWPFVLIYIYMTVIVGLVVLRRLSHWRGWRRDVPFLLNHVGLFVALVCATVGNADMRRLKMITSVNSLEWRAFDTRQQMVALPVAIELKRFIMEEYDDGSPRRFASEIDVFTRSGKHVHATVDVNKPVKVEGWKIYQYGYDTAMGRLSQISIFELVRDPWLPAVYVGIWMMLLGAVCMFILAQRKP